MTGGCGSPLEGEVSHMGHDEPLLGLVWGPWVLLAKAQTDLVLRLSVTILQVGAQFYGHQDCGGWAKTGHSHLTPTCAISHVYISTVCPCSMPTSTSLCLSRVPHLCSLKVLTTLTWCPYAHYYTFPLCPFHPHCHSPMPILCPVPLMPTP